MPRDTDKKTSPQCACWFKHPAVRWLTGTLVALAILGYSSKGVSELLLWGLFVASCFRVKQGLSAWKSGAGLAAIVVCVFTCLSLPLSQSPQDSFMDLAKMARIVALAWALPILWPSREAMLRPLLYAASAMTCLIAFDLARLIGALGFGDLAVQARFTEPYLLNHPNVSSIMAGLCLFLWVLFIVRWRGRPALRVLGVLGSLLCIVYLYAMASRGPQLAWVISLVGYGFLLATPRLRWAWFGACVVGAFLLVTQIEHINQRFTEQESMQTFSARDKVWSHTVSLIGKRPWLGYGVGKKVFVEVYSESDPPESVFYYPHPHQYGLAVLFSLGAVGGVLYGAMWILLMLRLARATLRERSGYARVVPGTVALMMGMILLYGMGDYPDSLVKYALIWLIPVALVVTKKDGAEPSAGGES